MKNSLVFVGSVIMVLLLFGASLALAMHDAQVAHAAQGMPAPNSTCPLYLMEVDEDGNMVYPGVCVTDLPGVQIENVPLIQVAHLKIYSNWQPDRELVQVRVVVPDQGIFNNNKYRIELVSYFTDRRTTDMYPGELTPGGHFMSAAVHVRLVCDPNGSSTPTLSFSTPRQEVLLADGTMLHLVPTSTMLDVVNWEEIGTPCDD